METFMINKKIEIIEAKFKTKSQILLEISVSEDFRGYYMIIKDESILVIVKN